MFRAQNCFGGRLEELKNQLLGMELLILVFKQFLSHFNGVLWIGRSVKHLGFTTLFLQYTAQIYLPFWAFLLFF